MQTAARSGMPRLITRPSANCPGYAPGPEEASLGGAGGEPLRHPPAHRVADHVGAVDGQRVEQTQRVAGEPPGGVGARRARALTGPALVVADHREVLGEDV